MFENSRPINIFGNLVDAPGCSLKYRHVAYLFDKSFKKLVQRCELRSKLIELLVSRDVIRFTVGAYHPKKHYQM
jgi:hypothetical protein